MNTLAIVIVSYNTRGDLENCLQSLHDHPPHVPHEIVVVDNASRDGSVEAVRARWPDVTVITLNSNVGFSSANNAAIRRTDSELLLLLNSDTIVSEGAIDRLIAAMHELPDASVVGPKIIDANGQAELSYGRMMTPLAELRQKLLVRHASPLTLSRLTSETRQVDWVTAACMLVPCVLQLALGTGRHPAWDPFLLAVGAALGHASFAAAWVTLGDDLFRRRVIAAVVGLLLIASLCVFMLWMGQPRAGGGRFWARWRIRITSRAWAA